MIDKTLITKKIALIQEDLDRLKVYEDKKIDDVMSDWVNLTVVERLLERIIGRSIDINQHIIMNSPHLENAATLSYKETFLKLSEVGVYNNEFGEKISKSVGLRNILIHEYNHVEERIIYTSIGVALEQYSNYCKYVLAYIKSN